MGMPSREIPIPEEESTSEQRQMFLNGRSKVIASVFIGFLVLSIIVGLVVGMQFKEVDRLSLHPQRRSGLA